MQLLTVLLLVCGPAVLLANSVPGAPNTADVNNPHIKELRKFVETQLKGSSGAGKKQLGELKSVTVQVVAGTLTKMIFDTENGEECSVSIWEQSWLNMTKITKSSCGHDISKRSTDSDNHMTKFHKFMADHNKQYESRAEYKKRYHVFKANLKKAKMMQDNEQGSAKYGVTQFSDLTEKEFKLYLGLKKPEKVPQLPQAEIPKISVPDAYDWRDHNAVTPVKNQGSCGSCWAFSVTGNIEGQWAIKNNELLSLSEQEIVDCDSNDDGCNGGYMTTAYDSIARLGGLETESDYPYEAETDKCHLNPPEIKVQISGGINITSDEQGMVQWLYQNGPISVGLNANMMQFYMGGVSHPFKIMCNPKELDHGVLIVGYGVDTSRVLKRTLPYWLIKNSWGKGWGELGYYRLYRGDGSCGINQMASSAVF